MQKLICLLLLFVYSHDCLICADENHSMIQKATLQLHANWQESKQATRVADQQSSGDFERQFLQGYESVPFTPQPLLVTTVVWADGFGDYVHLQQVLRLLVELGHEDILVVVFYASCHRDKLKTHPLPQSKGFSFRYVEFDRQDTMYHLRKDNLLLSKKEFDQTIANAPCFKEFKEGKRDLLIVASFFSDVLKEFKSLQGYHPLFLREANPPFENAILQDLYVLGWGRNQAMPADPHLLEISQLEFEKKCQLALDCFPEKLLRAICHKPTKEHLRQTLLTSSLHHAYYHQPASSVAFLFATLLAQNDKDQAIFFFKDIAPLYNYLSHLKTGPSTSVFNLASLSKELHLGKVEFHFLNQPQKELRFDEKSSKTVRLIETEFLTAQAYQLLISLTSFPMIEGCTGDHSIQQALLLQHFPLIEHTSSKDIFVNNQTEKHLYQNSVSLFRALHQLTPYPDDLSLLFYLSDLLMMHVREKGLESFDHPETIFLLRFLGRALNIKGYEQDLRRFSHLIAQKRELKGPLKQLLTRQMLLKHYHTQLPKLENQFFQAFKLDPASTTLLLVEFARELHRLSYPIF
ncbi:MAG: hypothetical protein ACSNEK_03275 [Parachlamydiaceae bacterium]